MQFVDQLNNTITLSETPKRIVCLVPSLTELLVDLGLEENIVGITKFCVHPKHIRKKATVVGGTKNVHFDKIERLQPEIILCNKEENTKEIMVACNKIAPVHISDIYTIDDTLDIILSYGKIFDVEDASKKIVKAIVEKRTSFLKKIKDTKKLNIAYFIWKKPWMVAANQTFINHLLELNNFKNIFDEKIRYPEITLAELQNVENLDCIFLSSEPYPFKERDVKDLQQKSIHQQIKIVDGEYFSWYGSRLLKAFDYFLELRKELV